MFFESCRRVIKNKLLKGCSKLARERSKRFGGLERGLDVRDAVAVEADRSGPAGGLAQ
jgi:hypothetical protein